MDQPALDRRLGTVGANPPCCFRTATHLVTHYHRYSRKRRRQAASSDIPQIKEAGCAHCCFFTPQPHRPKTRHQKWPSEIDNRNDAPVARSGTGRLSLRRMGPICADFGGPPANTGEDRTGWILASSRE